MGALARAVTRLSAVIPERKTAVGQQISTWQEGNPQSPRYWQNYYRYALEGYSGNELVFAAIEELATSAAEPRIKAMKRKGAKGKPEQLKDHPIEELFERPNPFMGRYQMLAAHVMYRAVAGNAYINLGRSAAGKVVEMWLLRPDRVFVIPDRVKYIGGWEYRLEGYEPMMVKPEDIIQSKTRNPMDDWYGLPPLAACAPRVDTDTMMRSFTMAFFRNAAVPAGLLNITKQVTAAERQLIRDKLRGESGGPQNWHQMMVLDNMEAKYTPMGMPLGASGIVLPELDEISEARISMVFGVPLEVIGARLGLIHGNRTTMDGAVNHLWTGTLVPLYGEIASDYSRGLWPEYEGTPDEFDYLEYDLSTVQALQEDEDSKHKRLREDMAAGGISVQEFRAAIGHEAEYEKEALLMLARGLEPMLAEDAILGAPPDQEQGGVGSGIAQSTKDPSAAQSGVTPTRAPVKSNGNGTTNGNGHGTLTPAEVTALKELLAARK